VRVLIVDDERMARESLQVLLIACKFEVSIAANYDQALEAAKATVPDVAIIDWQLADAHDGLTVARALCEFAPKIRILMTSGNTNHEEQMPKHPTFHFLAKPYQLATLLTYLRGTVLPDT
jgi:DNA-binding response OmpR family regulator